MPDAADDVDVYRDQLATARDRVARRLAVEASAVSIDGATFRFEAPLTAPLPVGGYVRLTTPDAVYLGEVHAKEIAERDGPELTVQGDAGLGIDLDAAHVAQTAFRVRLRSTRGDGVLLARLAPDGVAPLGPGDLFDTARLNPAHASDVERYLRTAQGGRTTLDIGRVQLEDGSTRALIRAAGFDRHTFLCGQSGSGKTYALGVILERLLLETDLRILIIDPNSDFVRLGEPRPFDAAASFSDADEHARMSARYAAAVAGLRVFRPAKRGGAGPNALRLRFSELSPLAQGLVLQLDPLADRDEFNAFRAIVERIGRTHYSLSDVLAAAQQDLSIEARRIALRISNLGIASWDVWAEGDEPGLGDLVQGDWRALVLDIGGFGSQSEKSLVAMAALGALWDAREERRPVLIVVDEAHNVCPQEPSDPLQATATERAIRIAGEGRKFGLYFLLASQRPSKLHAHVLSQADNLVLMRMNSAVDVEQLSNVFSFVPSALMERSSYFSQGESLLAGKIVPSPLIAAIENRLTFEGGSDVPTTWAKPR